VGTHFGHKRVDPSRSKIDATLYILDAREKYELACFLQTSHFPNDKHHLGDDLVPFRVLFLMSKTYLFGPPAVPRSKGILKNDVFYALAENVSEILYRTA